MFTIKILRRNASGAERTHIVGAEDVQVYGGGEDWLQGNARAVMYRDEQTGAHHCATVTDEKPVDDDHWPSPVIYIENSEGKTTEIVRPVGA